MRSIFTLSNIFIMCLMLAAPTRLEAYVGPGAGIAAIGTVLALIGGVILAIVAFIWYPIKRLLKKIKQKKGNDEEGTPS